MTKADIVINVLHLATGYIIKLARLLTLAVIFTCSLWSVRDIAGINIPEDFKKELERSHLLFDTNMFENFSIARIIANRHFEYSFAVSHKKLPLEARFSTREISPVPGMMQKNLVEKFVMASISNMARIEVGYEEFDSSAVKSEFGADWGVTSLILPRSTFSKYKLGKISVIYSDKYKKLGYLIFLFNDPTDDVICAIEEIFYAMRFK